MAFADQHALTQDAAFLGRVAVAVTKAALDILGENHGGEGEPTDAEHVKRAAWAQLVLQAPPAWAQRMVYGVVANVAISDKAADSDIEWTIASLVNDYAGID